VTSRRLPYTLDPPLPNSFFNKPVYPVDGADKLRQEAYIPFACGGNSYYAHGLPPNFHFETTLRSKNH
jgi:hypothetical protein